MYKIAAKNKNEDRAREEKKTPDSVIDKNKIMDVGVEKMNDFHSRTR